MSKLTEATPHERAMMSLRRQCLELYQKMGRDEILRQGDPVETLFSFAKQLINDREYVVGWNDGWNELEHRLSQTLIGRAALKETDNA